VGKDVYLPFLRAISSLTGLRISVDHADVKRVQSLPTIPLTTPLQITPDVPIWDVDQLVGHKKRVTSAAFSPDGRWLATGSAGGIVLLWDVAARRVAGQLSPQRRIRETRVLFSNDGRRLAVWHDGGVVLWDLEKRVQIGEFSGSGETALKRVAFSPDGGSAAIVVGSGNFVRLVRLPGFQQIAELETKQSGGSVDFIEDGQRLIYGFSRGWLGNRVGSNDASANRSVRLRIIAGVFQRYYQS
jgi:WD40 repeat protein